ncbi:glycosyltransferase family 2 protein [Tepidimonas fonticaldi]|uniref:glycosyltransferase family 2 protein n=1 Tax=Tepidimonas fonticaldi TaxID=1101373 RepID=UPI0018D46025|nr:glycosyltransferase family 2 protein [Tepidimonas fonticaldi]
MSLSVSIVSHGHGGYLPTLLQRLACVQAVIDRVWLTFDIPDPAVQSVLMQTPWPFDLRIVCNPHSQSYARNHNRAFQAECVAAGRAPTYWWILNPDIDWVCDPSVPLLAAFADPVVGLAYPTQVDTAGQVQDHARRLPTLPQLLRRLASHARGVTDKPVSRPDWVNGACFVVRGEVYARLGGFDERYRLYVEDVEFCLRLQLFGFVLRHAAGSQVAHVAHRRSRRHIRHLGWHLAGFARLWTSKTFWKYLWRGTQ